ncbi:hypothetical protein R6Q57_013682 [Mikania cordata]
MENSFHGDLADIFRPGSVISGDPPGVSVADHVWNYFDQSDDQETQMTIIQKSTRIHDHQGFGQPPFTSLLTDSLIDHDGTSGPCFFGPDEQSAAARTPLEFDHHNHNHNHDQNNNNIFSKMVQISPNAAKNVYSNSEIITSSSLKQESSSSMVLQISASRNPGIKRRKNQAKKVVCIPAPTPASSRPTGEVVPSDLWAWRKYGQKPIKGSPYPRGYYRCSSSKGCLARKQVERSKTDPNMLVITYTSEHNHPWPTQRNALAGSTRTPHQPKSTTIVTEQPPQKLANKDEGSVFVAKDELLVLEGSFPQPYRPEFGEHDRRGGGQSDDYFLGLEEIEVDPISLLLNQGFLCGDEEAKNYNKDLDPFG